MKQTLADISLNLIVAVWIVGGGTLSILLWTGVVGARGVPQEKQSETYYTKLAAKAIGAPYEHRLVDGSRVDILTESYAIEIDWADNSLKWAEAIGQARYYAKCTHRKPGIILLVWALTEKTKRNIYKCRVAADCPVWVVPVHFIDSPDRWYPPWRNR